MSTAEYVFAIIGILVIAGGFAYGIYDSYIQRKPPKNHASEEDSSAHWH